MYTKNNIIIKTQTAFPLISLLEWALHFDDAAHCSICSFLGSWSYGQRHLHLLVRSGVWDFVDLCEALADLHEGLILSLRQDEVQKRRPPSTDYQEHQESKGLQCLLQRQQNTEKPWNPTESSQHSNSQRMQEVFS